MKPKLSAKLQNCSTKIISMSNKWAKFTNKFSSYKFCPNYVLVRCLCLSVWLIWSAKLKPKLSAKLQNCSTKSRTILTMDETQKIDIITKNKVYAVDIIHKLLRNNHHHHHHHQHHGHFSGDVKTHFPLIFPVLELPAPLPSMWNESLFAFLEIDWKHQGRSMKDALLRWRPWCFHSIYLHGNKVLIHKNEARMWCETNIFDHFQDFFNCLTPS